MLPTIPAANQDLLMLLYQKQMQNNLPQANPLAQLMLLKNQFNILQMMAGDQLGHSGSEMTQNPLLPSMALMNQNPNMNPQAAKQQIAYLSNFLSQNPANTKNLLGGSTSHSDDEKKQSKIKSDLTLMAKNRNSSSKSLNIPAFNKSSPENFRADSLESEDIESSGGLSAKSKKIKKVNVCGHPERAHYAKNLCNQCYHKHGRTKKPWKCHHEKLYAHGLCQNCYINAYNKKRSQKVKDGPSDGQNSGSVEGEADMLISTISTEEPLTMEDKAAFAENENSENSKN